MYTVAIASRSPLNLISGLLTWAEQSILERGRGHRLVIANVGGGPAQDVVFDLVLPDGTTSFLIDSEMDELLPVTRLLPGQEVSMLIAPTMGTARHVLARVAWIDERGEHVKQNLEVTF